MKNKFNNNGNVSLFHSLGTETVKQNYNNRNITRNKGETRDLKSLALSVLSRKTNETNPETKMKQDDKIFETDLRTKNQIVSIDIENLFYQFEERIAICQFDGKVKQEEAEKIAFVEVLNDLNKKIKISPYE